MIFCECQRRTWHVRLGQGTISLAAGWSGGKFKGKNTGQKRPVVIGDDGKALSWAVAARMTF